jgi:predicted anti-sigma-YlaC factor YlaD
MGEIAETREEEIGCDECFEEVDRFIEMELSGLDAAQAMPLVREHLKICGECREEFEALLAALRATEEA